MAEGPPNPENMGGETLPMNFAVVKHLSVDGRKGAEACEDEIVFQDVCAVNESEVPDGW